MAWPLLKCVGGQQGQEQLKKKFVSEGKEVKGVHV